MKTLLRLNPRWLRTVMVCFIAFGAVSAAGCAGKTKTTTVTTRTTDDALASGSTTSVTTQQQVETDAHPRGVIGGVFYTIGQVLLFPFRVIGNLFS